MSVQRFAACLSLGALMILGVGSAGGQAFPSKPVHIITSDVGGAVDFLARAIAPPLSAGLGQPVIVDNKGGSVINVALPVAKAPPDGYTVLLFNSVVWLLPFMQDGVPYDPARDFSPVTLVASAPSVLVVHPSVAVTSVRELIALAKARPADLNYASAGSGSTPQLAAELFKSMVNVSMTRIPYKGTGPATIALIAGEVQVMFANAVAVAPHIKSGAVRALAVTSAQPSALFPTLATIAASGLPGYEVTSMYCILAPAKTPDAIINRLNREIVQVLDRAETKESFLKSGVESVGSTPQQLAATIKSDTAKWSKVIKDAGIRAD